MNKEVEQLLNKCDNCKLKECIGCEFTWTDIQKIRKYIQELEQKQSILDKVTDKLKEDIEKSKEQIKHYERQYKTAKEKEDKFHIKSFHRQINRWQSRFETLREILNIIETEKKYMKEI